MRAPFLLTWVRVSSPPSRSVKNYVRSEAYFRECFGGPVSGYRHNVLNPHMLGELSKVLLERRPCAEDHYHRT
jgi:hypothetical protein